MERGSARHHYNIKRPKRAGFGGVEEEVGSGRCRSTEAQRYRGAEAHKDESIGRFPGREVTSGGLPRERDSMKNPRTTTTPRW
jgi:hypothetical protein